MIGLTGGVEPHFGQNVWRSSGGLHYGTLARIKQPHLGKNAMDEIYDQGAQELDENKRKALYDEWQRIVADHCR